MWKIMAEDKRYIGFDIGAESGRCVVAVLKNGKIKLHEVHRFTTHNINYFKSFHWDVLAIFDDMLTGLKKAGESFGRFFDGIGVDTWGVDYVLIDADDRILGHPYHYRDDRTDQMMEKAFEVVPRHLLYEKTGVQFAQFNTLFQLLAEKGNKVNLLSVADKMLLMPDFLKFMLSGVKKSEYSIASTTGLTDPSKRDWSKELIRSFGFPESIFPEMVEPGSKLGTLLPNIAERTGLSKDIPVIANAGHDTASAVVSVPATDKNDWSFLSSGTWSLMGVELEKPIVKNEALEYNFTNEGGIAGTTRFLKNIIGLWPIQECRRFWHNTGHDFDYSQLANLARDVQSTGAWIDLNDVRFLKAGDMPNKILSFLKETGQDVNDDYGQIIRIVNESLAFNYRFTLQRLETVCRKRFDRLHAVGGGIQNELLNQLTADAIGCDVFAGPIEGSVIGNIGVQAIATGLVSGLEEWRHLVANSFDIKVYKPQNTEYFNKNESNYQKILNI
jgi:rhamnulokinase